MSFLNPVNEPVKRFKSTDAGAPQINYNARTADDVKAVLKACLVTGYGEKASAGWTIANETASYGEFTSPSASMSELLLKITDATASTSWSYDKIGTLVKSVTGSKAITGATLTHADNGWQVLVTDMGLFYIEIIYAPEMSATTARVFYFGAVKSAHAGDTSGDAGLWCTGWALSGNPYALFKTGETNNSFEVKGANSTSIISASFYTQITPTFNVSDVDVASEIFILKDEAVVAKHPAILAIRPASTVGLYGVRDTNIDGRPALYLNVSSYRGSLESQIIHARYLLIFLDYWEY